jgi:hypothetical protein
MTSLPQMPTVTFCLKSKFSQHNKVQHNLLLCSILHSRKSIPLAHLLFLGAKFNNKIIRYRHILP